MERDERAVKKVVINLAERSEEILRRTPQEEDKYNRIAHSLLKKGIDNLNLSTPDLIKIDAQYSEAAVLRGGIKTIALKKPKIVFENCINFKNPSVSIEPLVFLEKLGYRLYYPCWLDPKSEFLIPSVVQNNNYSSSILLLHPIKSCDRFLYSDMINIYACHLSQLVFSA